MKKTEKGKTNKLRLPAKTETPASPLICGGKAFKAFCTGILAVTLIFTAAPAFAAGDDPIQVVSNLSTFIFGLIRAIGIILLAFGIVQVGLSLKSHDPSQRANGFLTLAGGVIITFAKEILNLIAPGLQ